MTKFLREGRRESCNDGRKMDAPRRGVSSLQSSESFFTLACRHLVWFQTRWSHERRAHGGYAESSVKASSSSWLPYGLWDSTCLRAWAQTPFSAHGFWPPRTLGHETVGRGLERRARAPSPRLGVASFPWGQVDKPCRFPSRVSATVADM